MQGLQGKEIVHKLKKLVIKMKTKGLEKERWVLVLIAAAVVGFGFLADMGYLYFYAAALILAFIFFQVK